MPNITEKNENINKKMRKYSSFKELKDDLKSGNLIKRVFLNGNFILEIFLKMKEHQNYFVYKSFVLKHKDFISHENKICNFCPDKETYKNFINLSKE